MSRPKSDDTRAPRGLSFVATATRSCGAGPGGPAAVSRCVGTTVVGRAVALAGRRTSVGLGWIWEKACT